MTGVGGTQRAREGITQHFACKLPLKIKEANVDIRGKGGET